MNKEFQLSLRQLREVLSMSVDLVDDVPVNLIKLKENLDFAYILAKRLEKQNEAQLAFQRESMRHE